MVFSPQGGIILNTRNNWRNKWLGGYLQVSDKSKLYCMFGLLIQKYYPSVFFYLQIVLFLFVFHLSWLQFPKTWYYKYQLGNTTLSQCWCRVLTPDSNRCIMGEGEWRKGSSITDIDSRWEKKRCPANIFAKSNTITFKANILRWKVQFQKKSRIRERKHLSTDADSSNDTKKSC